jgi:hypothetical protein
VQFSGKAFVGLTREESRNATLRNSLLFSKRGRNIQELRLKLSNVGIVEGRNKIFKRIYVVG